jgi:hypothetical protein
MIFDSTHLGQTIKYFGLFPIQTLTNPKENLYHLFEFNLLQTNFAAVSIFQNLIPYLSMFDSQYHLKNCFVVVKS